MHLLGPKPVTCALARIKLQLAARNLLFNANSARCSCNCWHFDCHNMHSAPFPTPARGNKQLVDLYFKIIFTPSSKHKKQKTSQGSFVGAVREVKVEEKQQEKGRGKGNGSSAVKLALNYLARSWFPFPTPTPTPPLRLAQVKAGHIVCKSARVVKQGGWGESKQEAEGATAMQIHHVIVNRP